MSSLNGKRLFYLTAALFIVACGLIWRWPGLHLPAPAAKYGGSILWGAMMFFVVAALLPRRELKTIAAIAAVVSACVEFSQLIEIGWLDAFRRTTFGALLLGRTFTWWDILAYWVGIVGAWLTTSSASRSGRARAISK